MVIFLTGRPKATSSRVTVHQSSSEEDSSTEEKSADESLDEDGDKGGNEAENDDENVEKKKKNEGKKRKVMKRFDMRHAYLEWVERKEGRSEILKRDVDWPLKEALWCYCFIR